MLFAMHGVSRISTLCRRNSAYLKPVPDEQQRKSNLDLKYCREHGAVHTASQRRWGDPRMRTLFQSAWLDFMQLQQINYRQSFRCEHKCEDMKADGITLGFRCAHLFLEKPCAAPVALPPVVGSLPADRLLLPAVRQHEILLLFASDGCPPAQLRELRASICSLPAQAPGRALLPFLVEGPESTLDICKPPSHSRKVLYSVGTTAPECVLLPTAVMDAVAELVHMGSMSLQHQVLLAERAPVLYHLVKPALQQNQGSSLQDIKSLLRELLKVCFPLPSLHS